MGKLYIRVDDRLIHGQTIVAWCPTLSINEIIGVDDFTANNPMLKNIVTMSVPKSYGIDVVTIEKAKQLVGQESDNNRLLIVKFPNQVYQLKEYLKECEMIILGNMAKREDTIHQLTDATGIFYLSNQDVEELSELANEGFNVIFQQLPNTNVVQWESFRKSL